MAKHKFFILCVVVAGFYGQTLFGANMFVYFGTHRAGTDVGFSLAHFDTDTGVLTKPEFLIQSPAPAYFAFDPTGKWIICSNHDSNNALVFRVDENTGKLTPTGQHVSVPYPFCERFLPVH
jgi:6-phosphogluconolactonase (cycloisomerase 2 family)